MHNSADNSQADQANLALDDDFPGAADNSQADQVNLALNDDFPGAADNSQADQVNLALGDDYPGAADNSQADQVNLALNDDYPGAADNSQADQVNLALNEDHSGAARAGRDARLMQIEALLFVAAEPVALSDVSRTLGCSLAELAALVPALRSYFDGRGVRLLEHGEQLQLVSAPELTPLLERFLGASQPSRLSSAALEVLAIIAYRQPITRAQIEAIRGVDSSGVVRSLLARELIDEAGRAATLGRPILYATTRTFLQVFGIEHLDALPKLELPQVPNEPA